MAKGSDRKRSIIPLGMVVRGKIEGTEELTVAGTVDGEIHLRGTLRLLESGRLRGQVTVWEALIAGRVEGTVMASDRADLLSTAVIDGEIRARRLRIVEGAVVNGKMVVGPPEAHVTRLELIEEAVRWEEARRYPQDEGGGAA